MNGDAGCGQEGSWPNKRNNAIHPLGFSRATGLSRFMWNVCLSVHVHA